MKKLHYFWLAIVVSLFFGCTTVPQLQEITGDISEDLSQAEQSVQGVRAAVDTAREELAEAEAAGEQIEFIAEQIADIIAAGDSSDEEKLEAIHERIQLIIAQAQVVQESVQSADIDSIDRGLSDISGSIYDAQKDVEKLEFRLKMFGVPLGIPVIFAAVIIAVFVSIFLVRSLRHGGRQ